jgi:hypothetical protein
MYWMPSREKSLVRLQLSAITRCIRRTRLAPRAVAPRQMPDPRKTARADDTVRTSPPDGPDVRMRSDPPSHMTVFQFVRFHACPGVQGQFNRAYHS